LQEFFLYFFRTSSKVNEKVKVPASQK